MHWGINQAMRRASVHQERVTLTLRFLGPPADDASYVDVEVLGIEVRGIDDRETALDVLLGRDTIDP